MELDSQTIFWLILTGIVLLVIWKGVKIVPQQQAWVVERLGRFNMVLSPGLNILIPFVDRVAYKHSLKEDALDVRAQSAITKDNVTLTLDGVLYLRITDPELASYGVSDPYFALTQLAQTTMRSEIGKIDMDKTFEERETLNVSIVNTINEAAANWGIQCMRYEIKDINPPTSVLKAMEQQVTAEREKRAEILESEGFRQAQINRAEGQRQQTVLESEAAKIDQVNRAEGEATAIREVAKATAESISLIATSIEKKGGEKAVALNIAEQYVSAFGKLAQEGTTMLLPANANDAGSMVAQALAVYGQVTEAGAKAAAGKGPWTKPTSE